jgi:hypothetical protein
MVGLGKRFSVTTIVEALVVEINLSLLRSILRFHLHFCRSSQVYRFLHLQNTFKFDTEHPHVRQYAYCPTPKAA